MRPALTHPPHFARALARGLTQRKILRMKGVKPYTPNFKKAVEHYCIHAGGRAVIDGLEQNLELEPKHVLPSRATLNRVGNTYVSPRTGGRVGRRGE